MARTKTSFGRDPGLQFRMLLTIFLLGLLYAALVGAMFAAGAGLAIILVVIAGLLLAQIFVSETTSLASNGAKVVSPQEAPGLHAMIDRRWSQADRPKPKI